MMWATLILAGLIFFESLYFPVIPFVNYSDKLVLVMIIIFTGIQFIKDSKYRENIRKLMESRQVTYLLGLLLVSIISVLLSEFAVTKDNNTAIKTLVMSMAIFMYFASLGLDINKIKKMVVFISLLTLVVGLVSVMSYVNYSEVLKIIKLFFPEFTYKYFSYEFIRGRIAPIGGIVISFLLPISLLGKKLSKNIGWLIIFILGCVSVLLFNYRSYVISMLFGILFYGLIMLMTLLRNKESLIMVKLILIGVLIVVIVGTKLPVMQRFLFHDQDDMNNVFSRLSYMSLATDAFRARPITGIGLGNFQKVANPLVALEKVNTRVLIKEPIYLSGNPHNQLLLWLSETGVLGGLVNIMLLISFAVADYKYIIQIRVKKQVILALIVVSWVFVMESMLDATSLNLFNIFYLIRGTLLGYSFSRK